MIRRVWLATACLAVAGAIGNIALAQTAVTWDGGNGEWGDPKWNGGQLPADVMGNQSGGDGGYNILIGGGSQVLFDTTSKDLRPRSVNGPTTVTINGGAKLTSTTPQTGDPDGNWTVWDANLVLDNGTFVRNWIPGGPVDGAKAGGALMFGSWRSIDEQQINFATTNGGSLQNDGQVWFGSAGDQAFGVGVSATINNGTWDLTGGKNYGVSNNDIHYNHSDLVFWYEYQNEDDYEINFQGPGSITVDQGGIVVYRQDSVGNWDQPASDEFGATPLPTLSTYQQLWEQGILKSKGMTGGYYDETGTLVSTNLNFDNFFTVTGTSGANDYKVTRKEATTVTWSGGATGSWHDAEWDVAGGASNQTAVAAFGTTNGAGSGKNVVISGATVNYDPNPDANKDFRLNVNDGLSKVTLQNGGVLAMQTASDSDGKWTRWGGDLTIDGPGSKLLRTKDGVNSFSGGALMLGAYNQQMGQEIDIRLTNGGSIDNDGELYFCQDGGANAAGFTVTITIDGGSMNLRGGDAIDGGFGFNIDGGSNGLEVAMNTDQGAFTTLPMASPTMLFMYTLRTGDLNEGPLGLANEEYSINFTGAGTITVDHAGIYVATQDANTGLYTAASKTYEQLWAYGILQANGLSGLDGAVFSDFFTTTGTLGSDNYKLTSKLTSGPDGDFDGDGDVDGADFLRWQRGGSPNPLSAGDLATWKANFGASATVAASAAVGAVPEPSALFSAMVALCGLGVWRSRR
jgi:hypothetical protein